VPKKITLTHSPLLVVDGKVAEKVTKETQTIKGAGIERYFYAKTVDFEQVLRVKAAVKTILIGSVTYQVCPDEESLSPATVSFIITIPQLLIYTYTYHICLKTFRPIVRLSK
jgi:hypothetical protein